MGGGAGRSYPAQRHECHSPALLAGVQMQAARVFCAPQKLIFPRNAPLQLK